MAILTPDEIALLQGQKTELTKAMRSGALSVQHGDKRVQYRSYAEMQNALDAINDELAEAETGRKKSRVIYIGGRRGY